jgi:hypothetical protein
VTHGAVLCRLGRHDEALRVLSGTRLAIATPYRALAELGRGRLEEARKHLEQNVRWLQTQSQADPKQTNEARLSWFQRLEFEVLRGEVEAGLQAVKSTQLK